MKPGKSSQIKKIQNQNKRAQSKAPSNKKLAPFNYDEFVGFLRARFFLTHHDKYDQSTYEVASFFLDDLLATMVQQNFSKFTSDERAIVNLNEVMQAALVNSTDRDWRYFILLKPVLYDLQKFLAKEGQVNDRYGIQDASFDANFWAMIIRTVLALNYFRFQGKDVAELMKSSSAIDDLQFKFLKQEGDDDNFDLPVVAEVYRGLDIPLKPLTGAKAKPLAEQLSETAVQDEIDFAKRTLHQFQLASVKGVVTDNVVNMLMAFHQGLAEQYHATHRQWTAELLKTFASKDLLKYWQPEWDNLDGIGGEVESYLKFLKKQEALTDPDGIIKNLEGLDRYIDVSALNHCLETLDLDQVQQLTDK
ncbi:metaphase chromosome protein 1 [Leuconostocaceae bacterium ESL0723]|nr:metaphase chromosome protein 1 [Leuconostocaceae bacterium ESL0723]